MLPAPFGEELAKDAQLLQRMGLWQASQAQIDKLRYPRAVSENRNKKNRGGHIWFARHMQPRKSSGEMDIPVGLQALHLDGDLKQRANGSSRLRAQPLPLFDAANPGGDVLYGYDLFAGEGEEWSVVTRNKETHHKKLEPFDPVRHTRATDRSGGYQGQNENTRRQERGQR